MIHRKIGHSLHYRPFGIATVTCVSVYHRSEAVNTL